MKFDRLLSTLLLLQQRDLVPATELAERLEVSVRTVYRDVEALSAAGVPVYAERGKYGGIRLLPGFRTDMTGLTTDEARALFVLVGESAHSALGLDRALGSALRKMMAALPAPHRPAAELSSRRILIDPDRWLAGPRGEADVEALHTAVLADQRLRIGYRHSGSTTRNFYTVDPYGLVSKAGTWYLVADHEGRPRLFRTDRISDATVTAEPVRRRDGMELARVWEELRLEVEDRSTGMRVVVRVRRHRLDMVRRITGANFRGPASAGADPDGSADEGADGWLTVELTYPVPAAVCQLLQFGTDVEVLGPPEALRELSRAVAGLSSLYRPCTA
ncbi:YafY family transcriptional regulator [Streptomyces sp. ISL-98]|uniref:helix-turn-helix transcriptional regulator n=1 Tax=Streptomyces sp. ISL-98 TaxID=2819192 RepID=UPI001BECA743|nr:YafY family protein [Streptomyces sp. ISL-98]MBT2507483.1 YafY family transcriptional regulator [Streptomyces sp. ISL-98]